MGQLCIPCQAKQYVSVGLPRANTGDCSTGISEQEEEEVPIKQEAQLQNLQEVWAAT